MNAQALYRLYAQSKRKEAKEFVEIKKDLFERLDTLITKSNSGEIERTTLNYEDVVNFIIKKNLLKIMKTNSL